MKLAQPTATARRQAAGFRRQADQYRQQAASLDREARSERTLTFFIAVQGLGLAVGAAGGFFFTAAAPTRKWRSLTRRARYHEWRGTRDEARGNVAAAKVMERIALLGRVVNEEIGFALSIDGHHRRKYAEARGSLEPSLPPLTIDPDDIVQKLIRGPRDTPTPQGSPNGKPHDPRVEDLLAQAHNEKEQR